MRVDSSDELKNIISMNERDSDIHIFLNNLTNACVSYSQSFLYTFFENFVNCFHKSVIRLSVQITGSSCKGLLGVVKLGECKQLVECLGIIISISKVRRYIFSFLIFLFILNLKYCITNSS